MPYHNCSLYCFGIADWEEPTFCALQAPRLFEAPPPGKEFWSPLIFGVTIFSAFLTLFLVGIKMREMRKKPQEDFPMIRRPFKNFNL
ncbi:unnamed protein product [Meloidogyne enterolobii]|uniref:Uncharacterized protein n=1 Tax=Meloidogyne enterolobii TaxID=390850 RepID=A0ACB0Z3W9_MELEN